MARENSNAKSGASGVTTVVANAAGKVVSVAQKFAKTENQNCDCGACAACREKIAKLAPVYLTAVASIIFAVACGAISLGMGIAFFCGHAVNLPGPLGLLLSVTDKLVAPVAIGLFGVVSGLVALLAFAKIKKSPDTSVFVKSSAYKIITAGGVIFASFVGAVFAIYAVATALATLLALQNSLPYAAYYLGQFVPTILLGLVLIGTAFLLGGFAKAKVSSLLIWLLPWLVALVGFVLVAVAVGVKSHSDDANTIFANNYSTSVNVTTNSTNSDNNSTNSNSTTTTNPTNSNSQTSASCSKYSSVSDLFDAYMNGDISSTTYYKCVQNMYN